VQLGGTVRTHDPDVRDLMQRRFAKIVSATAEAYECTVDIAYERGYPVTVNTDENTAFAADVARAVAGEGAVDDNTPPIMAGEDFAYMLEARPGAYIFLGNGEEGAMVHHPEYVFDDSAIPAGCSWLAGMVEARMPAA
ncbi:MAG: M20/M25/M40 family metallo-hydrolase, partial [Planktotalea sp.]|uniref:M20/M25/M40 family metallo-hydrolase n=1 Tax=Planktotalea sp. TaxID=2029877 RepID=UPI003C7419DC